MFEIDINDLVKLLMKDSEATQGSESFIIAAEQLKRTILDSMDMHDRTIVVKVNL